MKGRHLAIGLLVGLGLALGFVFWLGATGGGRRAEVQTDSANTEPD